MTKPESTFDEAISKAVGYARDLDSFMGEGSPAILASMAQGAQAWAAVAQAYATHGPRAYQSDVLNRVTIPED